MGPTQSRYALHSRSNRLVGTWGDDEGGSPTEAVSGVEPASRPLDWPPVFSTHRPTSGHGNPLNHLSMQLSFALGTPRLRDNQRSSPACRFVHSITDRFGCRAKRYACEPRRVPLRSLRWPVVAGCRGWKKSGLSFFCLSRSCASRVSSSTLVHPPKSASDQHFVLSLCSLRLS